MNFIYRPLPVIWPSGQRTKASERQRSRFKSSYQATVELLCSQIYRLLTEEQRLALKALDARALSEGGVG